MTLTNEQRDGNPWFVLAAFAKKMMIKVEA